MMSRAIFSGFVGLTLAWLALASKPLAASAEQAAQPETSLPPLPLAVTTAADGGPGSLRWAITAANANPGRDIIGFDAELGPFAEPQTIRLDSPLPLLTDDLIIDGYIAGRLWQPSGVTVSGGQQFPVFAVAEGAKVEIRSLNIAEGRATRGGGVANSGELLLEGVAVHDNVAERHGGGVANLGGRLSIINSTLANNRAGRRGGGLSDDGGRVLATHVTVAGNRAGAGSGIYSSGVLLLRNSVLANGSSGADCELRGTLAAGGGHNLIERNEGCGEPIITADPRLQPLGRYNGPTLTMPLGGGSPAVNRGANALALDVNGSPLQWDQRGNGDPRRVGGIADIGAFEVQAVPDLIVDTVEDVDLRGCRATRPDCSLRGAITLANAMGKPATISFDPVTFARATSLEIAGPLPRIAVELTLDGTTVGSVRLDVSELYVDADAGGTLELHNVKADVSRSQTSRQRRGMRDFVKTSFYSDSIP